MTGNVGQWLRRVAIAGLLIISMPVAPAFGDETLTPVPEIENPDPGATSPAEPPANTPGPTPDTAPSETPGTAGPPIQTAPSDPAAVPTVPAVPEQALIDPVTGFQIERSSGYLIHPATGYLVEPGTGNLVDGRTWLYTDLRWDPATGDVVSIFDSPDETASPDPSPTTKSEAKPEAAVTTTPSPSPTAAQASLEAAKTSARDGVDWSTHWLTRTAVILLLVGAGTLYYVKLRGPGPNHGDTQ